MARKARVKSTTGIYHVLLRTTADLSLFLDEEDYKVYVDIINNLQQKDFGELYAYALFPTHAHLLVRDASFKESKELVGSLMKRIASAYSYYYNAKYNHYGPIYLDRFKSNPVETRTYFLKVLDHIGSQQTEYTFTCRHIPAGLKDGLPTEEEKIPLLDYKERALRTSESRLMVLLTEKFNFTNIGEFLQRDKEEQDNAIRECKRKGGSIRQIVRLTGCPFARVFKTR